MACGEFLYPERGQKQIFLTPSPPHLVHVVIEWPLTRFLNATDFKESFYKNNGNNMSLLEFLNAIILLGKKVANTSALKKMEYHDFWKNVAVSATFQPLMISEHFLVSVTRPLYIAYLYV